MPLVLADDPMSRNMRTASIPLPRHWSQSVRSALLHAIALARFAAVYTRSWAGNSVNERVRLKAALDRARQELALLREEIRIKDARLAQIPPQRRPHYPATERMAILELKASRGWSLEQTARTFLLTAATIASWLSRLDEQGPRALVQLGEPVNRFPDLVGHLVRRLKIVCPSMGKVKIAQTLARAGLHLGASTVGRMLREPSKSADLLAAHGPNESSGTDRVVTANHPNRVWHVDLTAVPTGAGYWTSWLPFTVPQRRPFCWWAAVVVDHFSRRMMGVTVFRQPPTSEGVRAFLGRAIRSARARPKYLICDKGSQFHCAGFRHWCRRKAIRPRFGAVGRHGSIAVIERLILTLKTGCTRLLTVPYRRETFLRELRAFACWFNRHRPHTMLCGRTPDEVYYNLRPAHRAPRFEPRPYWPRGSPCASRKPSFADKPACACDLKSGTIVAAGTFPLSHLAATREASQPRAGSPTASP